MLSRLSLVSRAASGDDRGSLVRGRSDCHRVYRRAMPPTDAVTDADVYVFRAALVGFRGVSRKLAVGAYGTLEDVHRLMQAAFGWDDDHLYAFWLSGKFWDREPGCGFGRPLAPS